MPEENLDWYFLPRKSRRHYSRIRRYLTRDLFEYQGYVSPFVTYNNATVPNEFSNKAKRLAKKFIQKHIPYVSESSLLRMSETTWESPVMLAVDYGKHGKFGAKFLITDLKPRKGDGPKGPYVLVTAVQGARVGRERAKEFGRLGGTPWANFLLQQIKAHSKALGFRGVAVIRPEFNPSLLHSLEIDPTGTMVRLYYSAAKKEGFRKVRGSNYLWHSF